MVEPVVTAFAIRRGEAEFRKHWHEKQDNLEVISFKMMKGLKRKTRFFCTLLLLFRTALSYLLSRIKISIFDLLHILGQRAQL